MRSYDEEDPKKPQPVRLRRKGDNVREAQEYAPRELRPDRDHRDHHRHVHRC